MDDKFEHYKQQLRAVPDRGIEDDEWKIIEYWLGEVPTMSDQILEWAFAYHRGYVGPRVRAALLFMDRDPSRGWRVIEQLIVSDDPDDRNTALTVLGKIGDSNKYYLAKPLLSDPYAYVQLDTVKLLRQMFPEECKTTLQKLMNHPSDSTRQQAKNYYHTYYG